MSILCSAQIIQFPDAQFEHALLNTLCVDTDFDGVGDKTADLNDDGEIEINEAQQIINLKIDSQKIVSLQGIGHFINLENLDCSYNSLKQLNLNKLVKLVELNCSNNLLQFLNVTNLIELEKLTCRSNKLEKLDLQGLTRLQEIDGSYNHILTLNINGLDKLKIIEFNFNNLFS